jgi:hypothetical protein
MHIYNRKISLSTNCHPLVYCIPSAAATSHLCDEVQKYLPGKLGICYRGAVLLGARVLPAVHSGGSEAEFVDQLSDAAFDAVADGADG